MLGVDVCPHSPDSCLTQTHAPTHPSDVTDLRMTWSAAMMGWVAAEVGEEIALGNSTAWDLHETCQIDHIASGFQCDYAREVLDCHSSTSVEYLEFAYCDLPNAQWAVYVQPLSVVFTLTLRSAFLSLCVPVSILFVSRMV
jgi:hypothetical protein